MRLRVAPQHPDFGRAVACECAVSESERTRGDRLAHYSNIGPLSRLTFGTLIARGRSAVNRDQERYQQCVAEARAFAEAPDGWLVLCGASGCGKTHIAAAIVNRLIERGEAALFVVVPDLLDHLRATYHPASAVTYDERFEAVRTVPLLVLDDLGAESPTQWAQEKLFQIINHRYNEQLPTVITSNVDLDRMDGRIRSRLLHTALSRHVYVNAADYRLRDVPERRAAPSRRAPAVGLTRPAHRPSGARPGPPA